MVESTAAKLGPESALAIPGRPRKMERHEPKPRESSRRKARPARSQMSGLPCICQGKEGVSRAVSLLPLSLLPSYRFLLPLRANGRGAELLMNDRHNGSELRLESQRGGNPKAQLNAREPRLRYATIVVLAALATSAWIRSASVDDCITIRCGRTEIQLWSEGGHALLEVSRHQIPMIPMRQLVWRRWQSQGWLEDHHVFGPRLRFAGVELFAHHVVVGAPPRYGISGAFPDDYRLAGIVVAYWHPLLLAFLWLLWLRLDHQRRLRRLKRSARFCVHCGYDLRASTDRCPECGTAIAPAAPAGAGRTRASS
jgi:hypothetical protein